MNAASHFSRTAWAAGTLSAIIFVLPGLVILGYWQGFPFVTTAAVCATGGVLGVMFSVPLRRALVTGSDLPYPEGMAATEVLRIGSAEGSGAAENQQGLRTIIVTSLASAGISLLIAMKLMVGEIAKYIRVGAGADVVAIANGVFRAKARFIGAGTIGVAAIWTLLKIIGPIISGIRSALAANAARGSGETLPLTERDLPIKQVALVILVTMIPIAFLLWQFIAGGPLAVHGGVLIATTVVYILLAGVVIASVCGYMAGLIGASNSPISGVGILAVVGVSLMMLAFIGRGSDVTTTEAMVAYALFATAIVFGIATISNDNLQDLKTGQVVGATPWRQQVALVIGVGFGSVAIPGVLDLLNNAFGFAGAPGAREQALAAPQALLISALAKGVLGGDLEWPLLGLGAVIGVVIISIDELLGRAGKLRLPPLGVGMGVYLPMSLTLLIVVGSVIGTRYDAWAERQPDPETAKRFGVLAATGLIVGESLFGVAFAGIVAATGKDAPLAVVGADFEPIALWGGLAVFAGLVWWIYRYTRRAIR